ncbi:MAG: hypothetical protein M3P39_06255 [Actinomycetota bacterium]|nr:hypothetical protein [Actinomycetota bacterium]
MDEPLAAVAQRAMTRPRAQRFELLVGIDDQGRYLGLLPIEQLVHGLARTHPPILEDTP